MHGGMEEHRQAVALVRNGALAPVLNGPWDCAAALIRAQAGKVWEIPGNSRIRVVEGRVYGWLRLFGEQGFDGLLPGSEENFARRTRENSHLKGVP